MEALGIYFDGQRRIWPATEGRCILGEYPDEERRYGLAIY